MTVRPVRAAIAAITLFATIGAAQSGPDPRLARLDPNTLHAISAIVDSARQNNLPTEPIIDKALEGASKRAPGPRIVAAVRTVANALGQARAALGPQSTADELKAGAEAIRSGVQPKELERIRSSRSNMRLAVAIGVLGGLVFDGVPSDTASNLIHALVVNGATDPQLLDLRAKIRAGIAAGGPAAAVASAQAGGLVQVLAAGLPPNSAGTGGQLPSGRTAGSPNAGGLAGQVGGVNASISPADGAPAPRPPARGKPKRRP
jgi:hypothetical protein